MIQRAYITEWRATAPWTANEQVEQDLVISRSLVEIYAESDLARQLAFRGGTALHKLHLAPAVRYSEDIDLVQVEAGPIGKVIDRIRERLAFLGRPRVIQKERNNTIVFAFDSEIPPTVSLKLKVEINCREHAPVFGTVTAPFEVKSLWYSGSAGIRTYTLEELLGSKTRALYQRRKGRDLFDLWYALVTARPSGRRIADSFTAIMQADGLRVTQRQFARNMAAKLADSGFRSDTAALLRPGTQFNPDAAWALVASEVIGLLP